MYESLRDDQTGNQESNDCATVLVVKRRSRRKVGGSDGTRTRGLLRDQAF